jgi:hypothetical protein
MNAATRNAGRESQPESSDGAANIAQQYLERDSEVALFRQPERLRRKLLTDYLRKKGFLN